MGSGEAVCSDKYRDKDMKDMKNVEIGIAGAGTMGRGIAEAALLAGFRVLLLDASIDLAAKGASAIKRSVDRGVEKGRLTEDRARDMLQNLHVAGDYVALDSAGIIIEAVYEDLAVKKEVLRHISESVSPEVLIGSNTSSLSVTAMASAVSGPERFLGVHFFNPVPVMKLVEVVPGASTSPETVERASSLARAMGKTPVLVAESPGFVVNRLLCPLMNEAAYLAMEGVATPEDIDTAMKLGANHPIGPLALADLVGIDVLYAIMRTLESNLKQAGVEPGISAVGSAKYAPCPLLAQMIQEGHLGRKTGRGFFSY